MKDVFFKTKSPKFQKTIEVFLSCRDKQHLSSVLETRRMVLHERLCGSGTRVLRDSPEGTVKLTQEWLC